MGTTPSSNRRAATRAARARQAQHGEKYNSARRQATDAGKAPETIPPGHPFKGGHWMRERCAEWHCNLERDAPAHQIGGLTPPEGWQEWAYGEPMLSTTHDDTTRTIAVLDGQGDTVLASTTAPWRPADELLAEYKAEDLLRPGIREREIALGRPDLLAHELGYTASGWQQWPDGSWRSPAHPLRERHVATIGPLAPGSPDLQVLTVHEVPGGRVVLDEMIDPIDPSDTGVADERLHQALDRHGYTVSRWGWTKLPGRVRYGLARPGHRAERSWWTRAKVRILRDHTAGCPDLHMPDHTFRAGEIVTMIQHGSAGTAVDRDTWWSSTDIDGSYAVRADNAEVVEVLEDVPPTWAQAALPAQRVLDLIGPYHDGAAEAVAAWYVAGLVVTYSTNGLSIYTPGPEHRLVGELHRDYWDGHAGQLNRYTKPYEAVVTDQHGYQHTRRFRELPLDPAAAVAQAHDALKRDFAKHRAASGQ